MNKRFPISLLYILPLLVLLSTGCSSDQGADMSGSSEIAADPHAGHDHGPGEHGIATTEALDWCYEHEVPESVCTTCNPSLIDGFKATGDWCAGHGVPESHCRLCNSDISFPQEAIVLAQSEVSLDDEIQVSLWFRPNASVCATNGSLIQFASVKTPEKTGLTVQTALSAHQENTVEAPAEVVFDESRSNVIASTVPALVSRWLVSPGDQVREGDVLAVLNSAEMAELQSRLLAAHASHQMHQKELSRHKDLKAASLISDSEYESQVAIAGQARAEYIAARGLLLAAGLSANDVEDVVTHEKVSNTFALRAPSDGILVDRIARLGELLDAGGAFALLADPSSMWIEAQLTEDQLRHIDVGQTLVFTSDGRGMDRVGAEVIWVARFIDQHSRTGTVRARVVDPLHVLRSGEFGRVSIVRRAGHRVTLVPKDAVQWEGCCNVVFVRETDLRYRPRKVELLGGSGPFYQVSGDIKAGDNVVVDGAFLLKTELTKASLGSGCCGLEPTG